MFYFKQPFAILLVLICLIDYTANCKSEKEAVRQKPLDIVFCIDLSGSTNGLIDDVREQLWTVINQVHKMHPTPEIRMGVIGFSRPSFGKENAYVKVLSYLTNDFDSLAYELYKLKPAIEQGDQYVNAALLTAMDKMNWGKGKNNTKIIFIIGNGMASVRGVDLERTGEQLAKQKIIVNSLFVLSKRNSKSTAISGWKRIAELTNGMQSEIVVDKREVVTDVEMNFHTLKELNNQLNQTYLYYYGAQGKVNFRRLRDLDSALFLSGFTDYYQRIWFKQTPLFQNKQVSWDMVDFLKSPSGNLDLLDSRTFPDSLQFYTVSELNELVLFQKDKRNKILNEINLMYKNNFIETQHKKFVNNEFPDSNIFSRCVINMLLREWK